jgi:hypothetical protein
MSSLFAADGSNENEIKPRPGVVTNMLELFRNGDVGFIALLDVVMEWTSHAKTA